MNKDTFHNQIEFERWKDIKTRGYLTNIRDLIVQIPGPDQLTSKNISALIDVLDKNNWVIYESEQTLWSKSDLVNFAGSFGLKECDQHLYGEGGVSDIRVSDSNQQGEFIPYTNKGLNWHTDGYYNPNQNWVTAIVLHCNQPAVSGGVNQIVDPDLLFIHLHKRNPDYLKALMKPDCLTIPGYDNGLGHVRPDSQGPVFWFNHNGILQMRYSQRKTNITWSNDPLLFEAREIIDDWLVSAPVIAEHRLSSGQGILSRNVLHKRTAFNDHSEGRRHLLRARYLDSIEFPEEE